MTPEEQARRLAEWLDGHPGAEPPPEIDAEVVEAVYALRPDLAPPPRVSVDDILAEVSAGPLAAPTQASGGGGGTVEGPVVPFPGPHHHAPAPPRRRPIWAWGTAAGGLVALAAAALLVVRYATPPLMESAPRPASSSPMAQSLPSSQTTPTANGLVGGASGLAQAEPEPASEDKKGQAASEPAVAEAPDTGAPPMAPDPAAPHARALPRPAPRPSPSPPELDDVASRGVERSVAASGAAAGYGAGAPSVEEEAAPRAPAPPPSATKPTESSSAVASEPPSAEYAQNLPAAASVSDEVVAAKEASEPAPSGFPNEEIQMDGEDRVAEAGAEPSSAPVTETIAARREHKPLFGGRHKAAREATHVPSGDRAREQSEAPKAAQVAAPASDLGALRAEAVPADLSRGALLSRTPTPSANALATEGHYDQAAQTALSNIGQPMDGTTSAAQAAAWYLAAGDAGASLGAAEQGLSHVTGNTPEVSWLWVLRGDAQRAVGDPGGAAASYRQAIDLNTTRVRLRDVDGKVDTTSEKATSMPQR